MKRRQQLLDSRGIRKSQQFLLFGERIIREILKGHPDHCLELIYPTSWPHLLQTPTTVSHYILEGQLCKTVGLLNIAHQQPIRTPNEPRIVSGRECSKKHALSLSEGSIQQGRSHFDERSVLIVREHGKRARTPLAAFFNIPTVDVFETRALLLVCKTPAIRQWDPEEAPQGLELVCPIGDPSNVGAVLRTCQALRT